MLSEFITFEPDRLREASLGAASFLGSSRGPSLAQAEGSPTLPLILPEEYQQEGEVGFGGLGSGQPQGPISLSVGGSGCISYGLEVGACGC